MWRCSHMTIFQHGSVHSLPATKLATSIFFTQSQMLLLSMEGRLYSWKIYRTFWNKVKCWKWVKESIHLYLRLYGKLAKPICPFPALMGFIQSNSLLSSDWFSQGCCCCLEVIEGWRAVSFLCKYYPLLQSKKSLKLIYSIHDTPLKYNTNWSWSRGLVLLPGSTAQTF